MVGKREQKNPAYLEGVLERGVLPAVPGLTLTAAQIGGVVNSILW